MYIDIFICNMKNLLIISYDFCLEAGGIQNTSYLLAEELSKYMKVFTFCPADGHIPEMPSVLSYQSKYINKGKDKPLYEKEAQNILGDIHLRYHIDYVLVPIYTYAKPAVYLKRKYGVPYGVMTHGNEVMHWSAGYILEHPRSRLRSLYARWNSLRLASQVFSNTDYTKELVKNIIGNKIIYVINPPMGTFPEYVDIPQDQSYVILSIGRLVERKGFQNMIKAMPKILKSLPNIKYLVCGSGDYELELRKLVQSLNLEQSVIFNGRISEEVKEDLLSRCDLLVMPSFEIKKDFQVEGFGIALIEANAHGKFVISSLSGGIPEAVKENETGFLVEENDVEDLAKAVLKYYNPNFSYDPGVCIDWAKKRHISVIAKQYFDVISAVI